MTPLDPGAGAGGPPTEEHVGRDEVLWDPRNRVPPRPGPPQDPFNWTLHCSDSLPETGPVYCLVLVNQIH
ncbi:unnamed protein product [Arctogadus glacialis]